MIAHDIGKLTERERKVLRLLARGYDVMAARTPATGAGIVTCRREGADARQLVSRLRHHKMIAAPRQSKVIPAPPAIRSIYRIDAPARM